MEEEKTAKDTTLVFVYGTLKRNFPNYPSLAAHIAAGHASFAGSAATAAAVPLVVGPFAVPFLLPLPAGGRRVAGELFAASPRALAALDEFEGLRLGVYERRPLAVELAGGGEVVKAEAYFAHRSYAEAMWRRCGGEAAAIAEYTQEDVKKYVPPAARSGAAALIDAIKTFVAESPQQN